MIRLAYIKCMHQKLSKIGLNCILLEITLNLTNIVKINNDEIIVLQYINSVESNIFSNHEVTEYTASSSVLTKEKPLMAGNSHGLAVVLDTRKQLGNRAGQLPTSNGGQCCSKYTPLSPCTCYHHSPVKLQQTDLARAQVYLARAQVYLARAVRVERRSNGVIWRRKWLQSNPAGPDCSLPWENTAHSNII